MDLRLVPMAAGHIPDLVRLERLCFSHPWSAGALAEELTNPNAVFLVAQEKETVLGYAGMHVICGEGYIANIAVFPEHRGKGAAKALIKSLERFCTEFLTLEVRASNTAARSLYQAMGFVEAGTRKNYYTDPAEDGIICTKEVRA